MSLFPAVVPRFPTGDFAPLFRILDDFSQVSRSLEHPTGVRAFQPRFDVKEVQNGYELRGELPGVEQKDLDIEFTDAQTLIIKGRTEREAHQGTAPAAEAEQANAKAVEESETASTGSYQKASVEDEDAPSTVGQPTPAETPATEAAQPTQEAQPSSRYWVSERSVGEFQRTFNFPARVDQDAVSASLKNGILSIVVPKASIPAARRITVE